MKDKIVVVTGSNSGIGKATALQLAQMQAHVVMVCRSPERGAAAQKEIIEQSKNEKVDLLLCDLASQTSIQAFSDEIHQKYSHIDVLLNNAGCIFGERILTPEGFEQTFALNHLGYFLSTHYLLDLVKEGQQKRIVNVSSLGHKMVQRIDWDNIQGEKNYNQLYHYCLSKLFNIYFTNYLAKEIQDTGITVNCLHPGTIDSGFASTASGFFKWLVKIGKPFLTKPSKGAATSVHLASSDKVANISGQYFSNKKIASTTSLAQDLQNAQKLWELSMKFTGLEGQKYGK